MLLALSAPLLAQVATNPDVAASIRLFEAWIDGQMLTHAYPGISVGVVQDQQLVWSKGFGFANLKAKTPMSAKTKFRMASHSKVFTATAIMQLRDQGKLRLDDPVSQHLNWFQPKPAEADDPPITIEDLLTHGSGLSREAGSHWSDFGFPTAAQVREYVASNKAIYPPGVRWKYSNLALTLAGMIVEQVSGEPYAAYIQTHIFDPLGMKDSSFDKPVDGLATGYGRRMPDSSREEMPFVDARAMGAATGLTSTVEDMARFVSSQFRKGKAAGALLSTGSLREMHRVRFMENDWSHGYAIGFGILRDGDKRYAGHGGSYPGFMTLTMFNVESKTGVIVLTNAQDTTPSELALRLMQTVGDAVAKAAAGTTKTPDWDPSWSRFTGRYSNRFGETRVIEMNKRLVILAPTAPDPNRYNRLTPIGNGQFRLESPAGGVAVGEVVRFTEENGRVTRMYTGGSFSTRVPD